MNCSNEDDICTSGEATPRIKIKFKTSDNKLKTLDSIFVSIDFGSGAKKILSQKFPTDSILLPLRVDDSPFTDIYVKLASKAADSSQIRINYSSVSKYVSPACGIKKNYENLNPVLVKPNPVLKLEQTQTQITNEAKTSLYLIF
jgi:hypothetical protein